jgi:hypothetical protein
MKKLMLLIVLMVMSASTYAYGDSSYLTRDEFDSYNRRQEAERETARQKEELQKEHNDAVNRMRNHLPSRGI